MYRLAAALVCLLMVACTTAAERHMHTVNPGDSVLLAPGEAASLKGSGMAVRFVAVTEDSRCPRDTTCIWAGEVRVQLEIQGSSQTRVPIELREGGVTVGEKCRVVLLKVEPYPTKTNRIPSQDYRATLELDRVP